MKGMNKLAIGFVAMVAAAGMVNAASSFAVDASAAAGIERHGVGGAIYSASQPMTDGAVACGKGEERQKVEAVERIGHGGSTYQAKAGQAGECQAGQKVDVVQRIGQGGSTYSSSQTMNN